MKVIVFCKYTRLGASSRLRILQYKPELKQLGVDMEVYPLLDDTYLKNLYDGKRKSITSMSFYYFNRIKQILSIKDADLLWIEYELFPYVPYFIEKILMPRSIPFIVDYDDAVFHNYDFSDSSIVRKLLAKKIDRLMSSANEVVCGNKYLAQRAKKAGAAHITIIPTVIDEARYKLELTEKRSTQVIGWIGSPVTQRYILDLKPVFEQVCKNGCARLVLVGADPGIADVLGDVPIEVVPWCEQTEAEIISGFDIGIMPLIDGPWERGKCGYKLIQYMGAGKPVVASPVGINVEIIENWRCGKLAISHDEWINTLKFLLSNQDVRIELGKNGRQAVESHYSVQAQVPMMLNTMRNAIARIIKEK